LVWLKSTDPILAGFLAPCLGIQLAVYLVAQVFMGYGYELKRKATNNLCKKC
jgi:hypothetical protein